MNLSLEISEERVSDLLHGHSGSISPWLHELVGNLISDGQFMVVYDLENDDEGDGHGKRIFKRDDVITGLSLMAKLSPYQFGQWLNEEDDDITFDTALQYIIFGKLVYG